MTRQASVVSSGVVWESPRSRLRLKNMSRGVPDGCMFCPYTLDWAMAWASAGRRLGLSEGRVKLGNSASQFPLVPLTIQGEVSELSDEPGNKTTARLAPCTAMPSRY